MQLHPKGVWSDIQAIKKYPPLVHNITNYVVMEQTANCLLAIGASPIMAHATEEMEDISKLADSLVLNIGTLSTPWIAAMRLALKSANKKNIPVIFDPVGCGASALRTKTSSSLLNHGTFTAIRGNASEIACLAGSTQSGKGVDSVLNASDCHDPARSLALKYGCIVWMSGPTDVITDGHSLFLIQNGHAMMGKVTGMGCTATAIAAAFLAVNPSPFLACAHAAILMGIAGEMAFNNSNGPGSFKPAFNDALYHISLTNIEECMRWNAT